MKSPPIRRDACRKFSDEKLFFLEIIHSIIFSVLGCLLCLTSFCRSFFSFQSSTETRIFFPFSYVVFVVNFRGMNQTIKQRWYVFNALYYCYLIKMKSLNNFFKSRILVNILSIQRHRRYNIVIIILVLWKVWQVFIKSYKTPNAGLYIHASRF